MLRKWMRFMILSGAFWAKAGVIKANAAARPRQTKVVFLGMMFFLSWD
jgi:hypothetical protein